MSTQGEPRRSTRTKIQEKSDVSQSVKPARKKAKKIANTQETLNVATEKRVDSEGKLSKLPGMPLDVLFEVSGPLYSSFYLLKILSSDIRASRTLRPPPPELVDEGAESCPHASLCKARMAHIICSFGRTPEMPRRHGGTFVCEIAF